MVPLPCMRRPHIAAAHQTGEQVVAAGVRLRVAVRCCVGEHVPAPLRRLVADERLVGRARWTRPSRLVSFQRIFGLVAERDVLDVDEHLVACAACSTPGSRCSAGS